LTTPDRANSFLDNSDLQPYDIVGSIPHPLSPI
jgi:hypothetical protein